MIGNRIVAWFVAIALGFATVAGWSFIPHSPDLDPLVMVVLWFNVAVMLIMIAVEGARRPYSLHLLHLISMFLFLGAASVLQYSRGNLGVAGSIALLRDQILPAAVATTLWLFGYLAAYELRRLTVVRRRAGILRRPLNTLRVFTLSIFALFALAYLAFVGLIGIATRGAAEVALDTFTEGARAGGFTTTLYIFTYNIIRALPPVALLASLLVLTRDPRSRGLALFPITVLVAIGTAIANNPFAAPRMFLICLLVAFMAPFFLRRFQTAWMVVTSILVGLAVLPALGTARHEIEFRDVASYFELISPLDYLSMSSDVDSLGMAALCQKWVERFGIRWGIQILGAFVAFVPRALWPSKPISTGPMVTEAIGSFENTNLSAPITAEAIVNFSLIGVPFFAAVYGLVLARLDSIYWEGGREGVATSYRIIDALYPFWLVCMVYFTRGDFFPAVTFTISFTLWIPFLLVGGSSRRALLDPARSPPAPLVAETTGVGLMNPLEPDGRAR